MEQLGGLLYALSSAFLLPTLAGVLALFVVTTYLVGRTLSEAIDRRKLREDLRAIRTGGGGVAAFVAGRRLGVFARLQAALEADPEIGVSVEREVADIENEIRARLERLGALARTGPMLGLIGTLIPLQPALAGLAEGNMQQMAANLLIGFTTTVVGLLVGGTAFVLSVVVRNWSREDLTEMRYLLRLWAAEKEASDETERRTPRLERVR